MNGKIRLWKQWLEEPQRSRLHTSLFQMHFWFGAVAGIYLMLMSITGSIIVFRNRWSGLKAVEWLVNLHNESPGWVERPPGKWRWRGKPDVVVPNWGYYLVAGCKALAPQFAGELARELPTNLLGSA